MGYPVTVPILRLHTQKQSVTNLCSIPVSPFCRQRRLTMGICSDKWHLQAILSLREHHRVLLRKTRGVSNLLLELSGCTFIGLPAQCLRHHHHKQVSNCSASPDCWL